MSRRRRGVIPHFYCPACKKKRLTRTYHEDATLTKQGASFPGTRIAWACTNSDCMITIDTPTQVRS